jgi:hypothetical protein
VAASKFFVVRERIRVQFRALTTNAFNHPNFGPLPGANISAPSAVGVITGVFGEQLGETSRQVYFSLRLDF